MAVPVSEHANSMARNSGQGHAREPFAIELGKRVRAAREAAGLTQRELSRQAKYDAVQLSRLESGDVIPRADALLRLAVVLRTPIGALFGLPAGVSMLPDSGADETAARLADEAAAEDRRLLAQGGLAIVEELRELRTRVEALEAARSRKRA